MCGPGGLTAWVRRRREGDARARMALIAVPTGIVSVELAKTGRAVSQACPACGAEGHDVDAIHCKYCGAAL